MPLVDRADSVLVIVDAQPGFAAGARGDAVIDAVAWLAGVAALLDIPVVVTEERPEREGPTDPRITRRLPAGTPVLTKDTFGLGGAPDVVAAIRATGRGTAVLTGFETDVCVAQSAIGLVDLGLRTVVLEDACFTNADAQHVLGLARLAGAGVERNHVKGMVFEWLREVDRAIEVLEAAKAIGPLPWRAS
jgi:nicotinamidase-related amidase